MPSTLWNKIMPGNLICNKQHVQVSQQVQIKVVGCVHKNHIGTCIIIELSISMKFRFTGFSRTPSMPLTLGENMC